MLSPIEKMLFVMLTLLTVGAAYGGFLQMWQIINRGERELYLDHLPSRLWKALRVYLTQETTLRARPITSLFHLGVVLGFTFYFLVNLVDGLIGFFPSVEPTLRDLTGATAGLYSLYRLAADLLTIAVLAGVVYFILRRNVLPNKRDLTYHDNVLLHPKVKEGSIFTDSMVVAIFILIHVGSRFMGEVVTLARHGELDAFQPFASIVSTLFTSYSVAGLEGLRHLFWWTALGSILIFLPYFPQSKHSHIFMAPFNFLTRPRRTSLGELESINFEDESREQFGAHTLFDLTKTNIVDAFACIQCNRCQDVCPAYITGKELSPSALEVNKRYFINEHMNALAAGEAITIPLIGSVISESAVWACTSCGACVDICPVGNEPMFDILEMRRDEVLTQGNTPDELQVAFKGMEKQGNPWGIGDSRMKWAEGLNVPTVADNPNYEILYWTGCAVSYDPRAQETARALVKVLQAAKINFAVLGEDENCTGDVARRGGNEYLYNELATGNVETLNAAKPPRIVVTCPHCLHNLGKEYHQFGGNYEVIHHTQLIEELINARKLPQTAHPTSWGNVTFHDPCYLGRQNDIVEEPRNALKGIGVSLMEMPRHGKKSLCCGAGGAQFWKEEEHGTKAVNLERYDEAIKTGAQTLAVGCPFCMQMFNTARSERPDGPVVRDIVEMVADRLPAAQPVSGD
jgi:Fe-S oxidoreductase